MHVSVEQVSPEEVHLDVAVDKERLEQYLDAAYRRLVARYRVPGFRPGKAPRPIFERFVGRSVLLDEALDRLVPDVYREAVRESGIEPYEQGVIEEVRPTEDGVRVRARVYLRPEVTLPDLKGIRVEVPVEPVTPAMVDDALEQLRQERGTLVPAEEADADAVLVVEGDVTTEGETEHVHNVEVRLADAYPEIRDGLLGAKVGDERTIVYREGERERSAHLKVLAVQRVELPAVDDDLARALGHENLEELRAELTKYIGESLARRARREKVERTLNEIVARSAVQVPEFLVERQKEHLLAHHTKPGQEISEEELVATARSQVREMLVVERLLEQEGIAVSSEELEQALAAFAVRTKVKKVSDEQVLEMHRALIDAKLADFLARLGEDEEHSAPARDGETTE